MKDTKLFLIISVFIITCSIAQSEIVLIVDGQDPATQPLELQSNKSIEIGVVDSEALETCYDFTLSVTGGVFLYEDLTANSSASSKLIRQETVDIQTTDLAALGNIFFEFENNPGLAVISLTTNQSLIIGSQTIPADTEIYQLILFDMPEDRVVIFGVNYESLSYEPPVQEESVSQSLETESLESLDFGGDLLILPPVIEQNEPEPIFLQSPVESSGSFRDELDDFAEWSQQFAMLGEGGSEPNVIEINSDITTNTVWNANNVYYITDANGVDVQALLVIEPNTTVIFGYQCGLFVNNGGTLIAKGTSDKPIIFTPDWMYYDYPDYIGYYWQVLESEGPYYYSPIYIQDTASPATTVRYCMIEGAVGGIVTNNIRLTNPIENNYLFGNIYGIYEFGPKLTDIRNNLCFYQDQAAIEVWLCPDPNVPPDTENLFTIEQNTCDSYQYCGITVHGVSDANEAPTVYLLNNIVSSNYWYGLNLVDGYMQMIVVNTGYYNNGQNKNWEFDEYNPVVAQSNPYYPYIGEKPFWHHHLAEGSDFIDAGLQYIEQTKFIGMTTNSISVPDKNVIDLGFHHMDWSFVGVEGVAGAGIDDLIEISEYWLEYSPFDPNSPCYIDPNLYIYDPNHPENWIDPNLVTFGGDWNDNGFVDLTDFALMAQLWQASPDEPNIIPVINGNPNNGWVEIYTSGCTSATQDVFAFLDGKYVGKFPVNSNMPLGVDVSEFGHIPQQLKLIAIDYNGYVYCSGLTDITFSSPLSYCILPESHESNEPIPFAAYNTEPNIASSVSVYANGGQLIWSQIFDGNSICSSIPASITTNYDIEYVQFESSSGASVSKMTSANQPALSPPDPNVIALVVLPDWLLRKLDFRTINAVQEAFDNRGVKYKRLSGKAATYANIAKYAPQLKYLFIDAHGTSSVQEGMGGECLRTLIELNDGDVVSAKASDFTGSPPTWCKWPLPGRKEQTLKSFITMGFTDLRYFDFDGCLGAHLTIDDGTGELMWGAMGEQGLFDFPQNDMSVACGMTNTSESRFYTSWFNESESRVWPNESSFQKFTRNKWEALGDGEELYWAYFEAISQQDHFGPDDPVQNYRIKGQGDLQTFRIRANP